MLERKIKSRLQAWKADPDRKPLLIKGIRQCGKTSTVLDFARRNYRHVVALNFYERPEYASIFSGSLDVNDLIMNMTAFPELKATFEPGRTVLVLDEIQECPEARTALKFFKLDGRFDVIGTGSLLGVRGYGMNDRPKSVPVGYETTLEMRPMDFEEFLWANGIPRELIETLRTCLAQEKPVPEAIHGRMRQLFLQYAAVGGMPEVVQRFVDTRQMDQVLGLQRDIVRDYEDDMVKNASDHDKPLIRECFESIPRQLSRENKKFQYSLIRKGGRSSQYAGCLQWIEDAGIIARCCNLSITELPLEGNALNDAFKVYMMDTGLFVSMLEEGTQRDVLSGSLYGYKGAIFENLIADVLAKMDRRLYYFRKDSGLELDFCIRYKGSCTPLEVKANTGNAKSLKTIMAHPEKYHVYNAIKLGDYNVGRNGAILTLPSYMAFLLTDL